MKTFLLAVLLSFTVFAKETRIKIAVIDTGIKDSPEITPYLCKKGHKNFTKGTLKDVHGHGTNVVGLIANNINKNKVCLLIIKYYHLETDVLPPEKYGELFDYVRKQKVKYINFSSTGRSPIEVERQQILSLLSKKVHVIVAAGNEGINLKYDCSSFPGCYNITSQYFHVVGAKDLLESNYGMLGQEYENGKDQCSLGVCLSGSSQATAVYTGKLAAKETR